MEQKEIKIISLKYRWKTNVKKISKVQEDAKGNSFVMETCILGYRLHTAFSTSTFSASFFFFFSFCA